MIVLGIDPGISGAFAFFNSGKGELLVVDMPVTIVERNGRTKSEVSPHLVYQIVAGHDINFSVVEKVGAMPGQAASGMFQFGRSVGMIEGVLASLSRPVNYVLPQVWRKAANVRGGKDASRARAMELFPAYSNLFARKKDDGRAEAALIAYYGAAELG